MQYPGGVRLRASPAFEHTDPSLGVLVCGWVFLATRRYRSPGSSHMLLQVSQSISTVSFLHRPFSRTEWTRESGGGERWCVPSPWLTLYFVGYGGGYLRTVGGSGWISRLFVPIFLRRATRMRFLECWHDQVGDGEPARMRSAFLLYLLPREVEMLFRIPFTFCSAAFWHNPCGRVDTVGTLGLVPPVAELFFLRGNS